MHIVELLVSRVVVSDIVIGWVGAAAKQIFPMTAPSP
jgi:hypothetical protein